MALKEFFFLYTQGLFSNACPMTGLLFSFNARPTYSVLFVRPTSTGTFSSRMRERGPDTFNRFQPMAVPLAAILPWLKGNMHGCMAVPRRFFYSHWNATVPRERSLSTQILLTCFPFLSIREDKEVAKGSPCQAAATSTWATGRCHVRASGLAGLAGADDAENGC